MILWDASEDRIVLVRGYKDLLLKDKTVVYCSKDTGHELSNDVSDDREVEKEISSFCWASNNGSVLAVGYIDGDIMFWNLSNAASTEDHKAEKSSNDVVKLQLSSSNKRLPVIVLHWAKTGSNNDCGGRIFVYGGDEVGSEEVLTVCFQLKIAFSYIGLS
jgi:syntaxin-binding protein 5